MFFKLKISDILYTYLIGKTQFPGLLWLFLGVVFAVMDEIYQSTVFGRFPSSFDVIADFIGLTLFIIFNKIFTKKLS